MPRQVEIVIPGKARGKERPRATRAGVVFPPAKTRNAEAFVKSCAVDAIGAAPLLDGPLRMGLEVVVEIPASWPKRDKEAAIAGTKRPTGRPDLDNICKLVADSLNGVVGLLSGVCCNVRWVIGSWVRFHIATPK